MHIRILIDNKSSGPLCPEWGLSVHVDYNGHQVLLDTGASPKFAKNAKDLGVDLSQVEFGVLSHGHYDHANGMKSFFEANTTAKFYLRKGAEENCYHTHRILFFNYQEYIGIKRGLLKRFAERIAFVDGDYTVIPGVTLVPHKTDGLDKIGHRAHFAVKKNGRYVDDAFEHEQNLVFDTPKGLVVMNSCSHGGADNIVKEIEKTFPGKQIYALLGGFHLFRTAKEDVEAFARRLKDLGVEKIYTGHCTGDAAFQILKEILGERVEQMYTGMEIEI